jgi:hypothetical protein
MNRGKPVFVLVLLNVVLGSILAWRMTPETTAHAQAGARGDYLIAPGKVSGATNGVIYILDSRNEKLGGFGYDHNQKALKPIAPIDLAQIFRGR